MPVSAPHAPPELALYEIALQHSISAVALCEALRTAEGVIHDFRYLMVNREYEALTNRPASELVGERVSAAFPQTVATGIWEQAADVVRSGQPYRGELRYVNQRELAGWYDVTISPWSDRGVVVSVVVISNEKARLLTQLQQADLLEAMIQNPLNGILVLEAMRDPNGSVADFRIKLANQTAGRLLNAPSAEHLVQTTFLTLFPHCRLIPFPHGPAAGPDELVPETIFERYVRIVQTGESILYDVNYQFDGLTGWYWVAVSRLNDGLLITFLDIAELKQTQDNLERTVHELEQTNRNLEQFAYVASHDLQEPLRKIQAFGDLLTSRLVHHPDEGVSDIVQRMERSAQRMQRLVKDLLAYSRLTPRSEEFRRVPLGRVVAEALADLRPVVDEKRAVILYDNLPTVPGDAAQLRQLFFALLSNALKFQPAGAIPMITISAEQVPADQLPGPLTGSRRSFVAVTVADNGIGFDEKYLDRIFVIFQRLNGRSQYDGTGIGLAVAHKVTENHGGLLTARSQPGRGAQFAAWLPTA